MPDHTEDPGPQSECPESEWQIVDALMGAGLALSLLAVLVTALINNGA
jgi:hypothetical protein